jgi:hypothetical protein
LKIDGLLGFYVLFFTTLITLTSFFWGASIFPINSYGALFRGAFVLGVITSVNWFWSKVFRDFSASFLWFGPGKFVAFFDRPLRSVLKPECFEDLVPQLVVLVYEIERL